MSDPTIIRKQDPGTIWAQVPARPPDRVWGGPGAGGACAICGAPITRDELEYELEYSHRIDPGPREFHVHVRCFDTWRLGSDSAEIGSEP